MSLQEWQVGPYLIRKKTLHYGIRSRGEPFNSGSGQRAWRKAAYSGKVRKHFTVLYDLKTVNSFLTIEAARAWCKEQVESNLV